MDGRLHQLAEQQGVVGRGIEQVGERLFRDDQHMRRRLRGDVAEGQHLVVFIDDVGGNFAGDDLGENGFSHVYVSSSSGKDAEGIAVGQDVGQM